MELLVQMAERRDCRVRVTYWSGMSMALRVRIRVSSANTSSPNNR
jgi:hypothetical protein